MDTQGIEESNYPAPTGEPVAMHTASEPVAAEIIESFEQVEYYQQMYSYEAPQQIQAYQQSYTYAHPSQYQQYQQAYTQGQPQVSQPILVCYRCGSPHMFIQQVDNGLNPGFVILMVLLLFIPFIGWIALIALLVSRSRTKPVATCQQCGAACSVPSTI